MNISQIMRNAFDMVRGVFASAPTPTSAFLRNSPSPTATMGTALTLALTHAERAQQEANFSPSADRVFLLGKAAAFFQFAHYLETEASMGLVDLDGPANQGWMLSYQESLVNQGVNTPIDSDAHLYGHLEGCAELLKELQALSARADAEAKVAETM